ncbi:hypothetical protein FD723_40040 (plasmid) [Nostoc sp. C052]|uniref:hypothetical protein n=1 Tax=Nostoc sp. C052 TaxID=2576902 RepID=UPI0015C2D852|nr:hypothetical protein [Nostoc sp. C052]QLE46405.1 hypothetical protein FD723_40040 [Nostoc sp. C052]
MLERVLGKSAIPSMLIISGVALTIAVILVPNLSENKSNAVLNLASLAIGAAAGVTQADNSAKALLEKSLIPLMLIISGVALTIAAIRDPSFSEVKFNAILNLSSLAIGAAAGVTQANSNVKIQ